MTKTVLYLREDLAQICDFLDEEALKELKECEFLVACDVDNHSTDKRAQMVAW